MIVMYAHILLIVWCIMVVVAEKKHRTKYFDEYYETNTPLKFKDTIKHHNQLKHEYKQFVKHKQHNNG